MGLLLYGLSSLSIVLLLLGMVKYLKLLYETGFTEYLHLFEMFSLSLIAIAVLILPFDEILQIRIFYIISSLAYLPFLFFVNKLKEVHKLILVIAVFYASILALSTFFWHPLGTQVTPLLYIPQIGIRIFQVRLGIAFEGKEVFSTLFTVPLTIFRLAISSFALYSVIGIEEIKGAPKMTMAKRLWVIALSTAVLHDILFIFGETWLTLSLFIFILLVSNYIIFFIPEGIILTKFQVLERYGKVKDAVEEYKQKNYSKEISDIYEYILEVKKIIEKNGN